MENSNISQHLRTIRDVLLDGKQYPELERQQFSPYYEPRDEDRLKALWELPNIEQCEDQQAVILILFWMSHDHYTGPDLDLLPNWEFFDEKHTSYSHAVRVSLAVCLCACRVDSRVKYCAIAPLVNDDSSLSITLSYTLTEIVNEPEFVEAGLELLIDESPAVLKLAARRLLDCENEDLQLAARNWLDHHIVAGLPHVDQEPPECPFRQHILVLYEALYQEREQSATSAAKQLLSSEMLKDLRPFVIAASLTKSLHETVQKLAIDAIACEDKEFARYLSRNVK